MAEHDRKLGVLSREEWCGDSAYDEAYRQVRITLDLPHVAAMTVVDALFHPHTRSVVT
jgi:hypothetical protein